MSKKKKQTERIIDSGHIDLYDKGLKITARSMTKLITHELEESDNEFISPPPPGGVGLDGFII